MINERDFTRLREKVELLTAERGAADKPASAVRRWELLALAARPMRSGQVAAAPTMDDFNALQADVQAIFEALRTISNALGTAKLL